MGRGGCTSVCALVTGEAVTQLGEMETNNNNIKTITWMKDGLKVNSTARRKDLIVAVSFSACSLGKTEIRFKDAWILLFIRDILPHNIMWLLLRAAQPIGINLRLQD